MESNQQIEEQKDECSGVKFMVCHDGSQASIDALNVVTKGLIKKEDKLVVGHVWTEKKEAYLPHDLKLDFIRE